MSDKTVLKVRFHPNRLVRVICRLPRSVFSVFSVCWIDGLFFFFPNSDDVAQALNQPNVGTTLRESTRQCVPLFSVFDFKDQF